MTTRFFFISMSLKAFLGIGTRNKRKRCDKREALTEYKEISASDVVSCNLFFQHTTFAWKNGIATCLNISDLLRLARLCVAARRSIRWHVPSWRNASVCIFSVKLKVFEVLLDSNALLLSRQTCWPLLRKRCLVSGPRSLGRRNPPME